MKRIVGVLTGLFTVLAVYSQTSVFQPEWAFGVNIGKTLSSVSMLPKVPQTLLSQESGGLTARYISERNIGIQVELNYSMRGWSEKSDSVAHPYSYKRSLAYIELPVMTHFYAGLGKRARLVFNIGPQIGFNIGEKASGPVNDFPGMEVEIPRYYDKDYTVYNKFDYGITGGVGIEIRTGIGSFILDGRYYYGLSDIFTNDKTNTKWFYFQSSHNQVIGIKLSYLLERF